MIHLPHGVRRRALMGENAEVEHPPSCLLPRCNLVPAWSHRLRPVVTSTSHYARAGKHSSGLDDTLNHSRAVVESTPPRMVGRIYMEGEKGQKATEKKTSKRHRVKITTPYKEGKGVSQTFMDWV